MARLLRRRSLTWLVESITVGHIDRWCSENASTTRQSDQHYFPSEAAKNPNAAALLILCRIHKVEFIEIDVLTLRGDDDAREGGGCCAATRRLQRNIRSVLELQVRISLCDRQTRSDCHLWACRL